MDRGQRSSLLKLEHVALLSVWHRTGCGYVASQFYRREVELTGNSPELLRGHDNASAHHPSRMEDVSHLHVHQCKTQSSLPPSSTVRARTGHPNVIH